MARCSTYTGKSCNKCKYDATYEEMRKGIFCHNEGAKVVNGVCIGFEEDMELPTFLPMSDYIKEYKLPLSDVTK